MQVNISKKPFQNPEYHGLFNSHPEIAGIIAAHTKTKLFHKNNVILHHNDTAEYVWLIQKGWVKLLRQTPDGKETIIGLLQKGDMFGEASLTANEVYPYTAEAITENVEVTLISATILREQLKSNLSFWQTILQSLNTQIVQTRLRFEHMNTMSTAQRLGCFLLRLCNENKESRHHFEIPIEKHILASYLGMKPETLSRSQLQLKEVGVTIKGAMVDVESPSRLQQFVCQSCSESGFCKTEGLANEGVES